MKNLEVHFWIPSMILIATYYTFFFFYFSFENSVSKFYIFLSWSRVMCYRKLSTPNMLWPNFLLSILKSLWTLIYLVFSQSVTLFRPLDTRGEKNPNRAIECQFIAFHFLRCVASSYNLSFVYTGLSQLAPQSSKSVCHNVVWSQILFFSSYAKSSCHFFFFSFLFSMVKSSCQSTGSSVIWHLSSTKASKDQSLVVVLMERNVLGCKHLPE